MIAIGVVVTGAVMGLIHWADKRDTAKATAKARYTSYAI